MGTPLTGLTVSATYAGLLKTSDNLQLSGVLRTINDGLGIDSALQLSTAGVKSTGTLDVTGVTTLANTLAGTGAFWQQTFKDVSGTATITNGGLIRLASAADGTWRLQWNSAAGADFSSVGEILRYTITGLSTPLQITSTLVTGTAPLVVASTTLVANLNASFLGGFNWTTPGTLGATVPNSASVTTLAASGAVTGAGFVALHASPGPIGNTAASTGAFTTLSATGTLTGVAANFSGQVQALSFNETSARKYKEGIQPIEGGLNLTMHLRPVRYNLIGDKVQTVGFIADEVNELFPSLVALNDKGEVESLNYARIVAVNTAAIQEMYVRLCALERKAA